MYRMLDDELLAWKHAANRKPLLIRGARQVGKSFVVEKFAKRHFSRYLVVNFELNANYCECFRELEPSSIIREIELISGVSIVAGETLLFFDEIQECPRAILALRYFKEKIPELHVVGAGSFLEFVINDEVYQQPVGRVQSLYLKPCSFQEYLIARQDEKLVEFLSEVSLQSTVPATIHNLLLERCREYFIIGGMPEVVADFVENDKFHLLEKTHASILEYYQRDLAKYANKINVRVMEKIFSKAPGMIATHFRYVDIDPDIAARDQKPPLEALIKSGVIYRVKQTSANGLPLVMGEKEKKFKLLFLDIGLAKHALGLEASKLLNEHLILLNQGNLAEQFVGQELLAYAPSYQQAELFYWQRDKKGSQAEVDYVIQIGSQILPVEVKAGKTGRLKSLQMFLDEKQLPFGIRISQNQLSYERRVLTIPIYLIHEIPRLVKMVSHS